MPGGFPGGMGGASSAGAGGAGMPDISQLFSDPELLEAFKVIISHKSKIRKKIHGMKDTNVYE